MILWRNAAKFCLRFNKIYGKLNSGKKTLEEDAHDVPDGYFAWGHTLSIIGYTQ